MNRKKNSSTSPLRPQERCPALKGKAGEDVPGQWFALTRLKAFKDLEEILRRGGQTKVGRAPRRDLGRGGENLGKVHKIIAEGTSLRGGVAKKIYFEGPWGDDVQRHEI